MEVKAANLLITRMIQEKEISLKSGWPKGGIKRIVDGKTYNTQTATEAATFEFDAGREDYLYFEETLYQTRTGNFFLVGKGKTEYSPWHSILEGSRDSVLGHGLMPLTQSEAKQWLEIRELADEYEAIFGSNAEPYDEQYQLTLRLPSVLMSQLKVAAEKNSQSLQFFAQQALEEWLKCSRN